MFFSVYKSPDTFLFEKVTEPHIHHFEKGVECFLIGDVLSNLEETNFAFQQFARTKKSEYLIFLRGNYQAFVRFYDELWVFSDLGNIRPVFYTKQNENWLFSSHLSILQDKIHSPLNLSWICRSLSTGGFHIEKETPYQKINMISRGFCLHINKNHARLFQAWNVDQEKVLSLDEAKEILKEELTASVLLRCQNKKITTELSGGLDSSTITWIASNKYPVKSITIIGKEEGEDSQIAKEIAEKQKNIKHFQFKQDEFPSVFSDMDKIYTDYPISFYWSASNAKKIFSWAKQNQSDIHFSGEGGDTVLGADFTYLVDLIQKRKWKIFLYHVLGWARKKRQSPWSWINAAIRLHLNIPYTSQQRHPLIATKNQADWLNFSTIIEKGSYSKYKGVSNTLHGIHYLGYVSHGLKNLAEQEHVNLCVPYLDHNIIQICIRVSSEEKMNPHELKPLLKRAFHNELPQCLLNRNTKGDYTSDVYQGMKENFSWFQDNFQSMILADLGLVDLNKFQNCFNQMAMGVPIKLWEFNHTLSLELWLRQANQSSQEGKL